MLWEREKDSGGQILEDREEYAAMITRSNFGYTHFDSRQSEPGCDCGKVVEWVSGSNPIVQMSPFPPVKKKFLTVDYCFCH